MNRASPCFAVLAAALAACSGTTDHGLPPPGPVATCAASLDLAYRFDGPLPSQLTARGDTLYWVEPSADGAQQTIRAVTLGGEPRTITTLPPFQDVVAWWFDGDDIEWLALGGVWRAPLAGGDATQVSQTLIGYSNAVMSDGVTLYAIQKGDTSSPDHPWVSVVRQPITGGPVQTLAQIDVPDADSWGSLYDEGDHLLFTYGGAVGRIEKADGAVHGVIIPAGTRLLAPSDPTSFFASTIDASPQLETFAIDGTTRSLWPAQPPFTPSTATVGDDGAAYFAGYATMAGGRLAPAFAAVHPGSAGLLTCVDATNLYVNGVFVYDLGVYGVLSTDQAWGLVRLPK